MKWILVLIALGSPHSHIVDSSAVFEQGSGFASLEECEQKADVLRDLISDAMPGELFCMAIDLQRTKKLTQSNSAGAQLRALNASTILSASPGSLCNTVEPMISRRRYVPVKDGVNGHEIFRIENGSKVAVCGAPVEGWFHISFSDANDHDFTGWVRAEYVK